MIAAAAAAALLFTAPVALPDGWVDDAALPRPPVVAAGAGGDALVQWQALRGERPRSRIALLRRGAAPRVVAAGSGRAAAAALTRDGAALLAFDADDAGRPVAPSLVRIARGGAASVTPLGADVFAVRLAALPDGSALVVTAGAGGGCAGLRTRRVDADGTLGDPAAPPTDGLGTRGAAYLDVAATGARAVVSCDDGSATGALWTFTAAGGLTRRTLPAGTQVGRVAAGGGALLWTTRAHGGRATLHVLRGGTDRRRTIRTATQPWALDARGRAVLPPAPRATVVPWRDGAVASWVDHGRPRVATERGGRFRRATAPAGRPVRAGLAAAGALAVLAWYDRDGAVRATLSRPPT